MIGFAFLLWGSLTAVRSLAEAHVLTRLEHDAEALLAAIDGRADVPGVGDSRLSPIYRQPLSGHYFVVSLADGRALRSRSLWDETLPVEALATGDVRVEQMQGPAGQRLLVRRAGYEKNGRPLTLLVAEDLTPMDLQIAHLQWLGLGLLASILVLVVFVQRWILRRGFSVLDEVRAEIAEVASGRRLQVAELGPDEIRPLGVEINRLLQQQQQRLRRSRQALGNLAHALKSPLTRVLHDIRRLPLDGEVRGRLTEGLTRISELIDRELRRARIAGEGVGRHFHPARDVPELLKAVAQLHPDSRVEVVTGPLPDAMLPQDHEDMLELLGNLVENAHKWADRRIEVRLCVGDDLCLEIADDGPGVDDEALEGLTRRGGRLDERVDGHGLGLSIVSDLVDDYGGSLAFDRSPELGGLRVLVRLPILSGSDAA
jgi:signal transduction histidine kinase